MANLNPFFEYMNLDPTAANFALNSDGNLEISVPGATAQPAQGGAILTFPGNGNASALSIAQIASEGQLILTGDGLRLVVDGSKYSLEIRSDGSVGLVMGGETVAATVDPEFVDLVNRLFETEEEREAALADPASIETLNPPDNFSGSLEGISRFQNLTQLALEKTSISAIPVEVYSIKSLISMAFWGSSLSVLPDGISGLGNLLNLYLGGTNLSSLPADINDLSSLRLLDARNLQISQVPDLSGLLSLQTLNLQGNNIPAEQVLSMLDSMQMNRPAEGTIVRLFATTGSDSIDISQYPSVIEQWETIELF